MKKFCVVYWSLGYRFPNDKKTSCVVFQADNALDAERQFSRQSPEYRILSVYEV